MNVYSKRTLYFKSTFLDSWFPGSYCDWCQSANKVHEPQLTTAWWLAGSWVLELGPTGTHSRLRQCPRQDCKWVSMGLVAHNTLFTTEKEVNQVWSHRNQLHWSPFPELSTRGTVATPNWLLPWRMSRLDCVGWEMGARGGNTACYYHTHTRTPSIQYVRGYAGSIKRRNAVMTCLVYASLTHLP